MNELTDDDLLDILQTIDYSAVRLPSGLKLLVRRAIAADRAQRQAGQVPDAWLTPGMDLRLSNQHGYGDWTPLFAPPPPVQPPTGYKLVPVEPTPAMIKAGGHVNSEWLNDNAPIGEARYALPMGGVYTAMLNAAPPI